MALPKLNVPEYHLKLPSSGKTVKYRPFLVKEEKLLFLAMETGEQKDLINAVKNILLNSDNIKLIIAGEAYESLDRYKLIIDQYDIHNKVIWINQFLCNDMIEILILSIIQGVTEFLPVSSSSHLILISDYV